MAYTDVEYKFKKIGKNVSIGKNVYFRYPELVEIGDNVVIDEFCYFTTKMTIGNHVHISTSCSCIGGRTSELIMKDFSGVSAGTRMICGTDDYVNALTNPTIPIQYRGEVKIGNIILEKHVILGTNTVVHPGVTIHEGAATGSMTLVTRDLERWSIYTGTPAKFFKKRNEVQILKLEQDFLNGK